jgi:hypothetical protein
MIREGKELAGVVGNARSTEDSKRVIDSLDARDSALNRYTASVASHSKISADRLQTGAARNSLLALADASLETDTKKRTNMMDSISKDLITQGFTNKEAQAIMASGNKNQSITQAAVDGQKNYNDATRTLAGGRLSQVIEYQAKNSAMSAEKISQVTTVAKLLGSASSVDDFKNVAAKYAPLLKESGAAGHNVVDTTAKMKKIQALKANDISGMKAVLGNDWNESYAEAARNKGTQGVVNQLYQNTQKGIMGNSVATGPGGVTDAGGTTAAQTLTQQVSINSEILAVMQGLAQRLKVK